MNRSIRLLLLVSLASAACSDPDRTFPYAHAGLYRLVSVNGQPVPWAAPPSTGIIESVASGDLLLHPHGRYTLGIQVTQSPVGAVNEGQWQVRGTTLTLSGGGSSLNATLQGDSVVLTVGGGAGGPPVPERSYLFRRVPMPPATLPAGHYILTTVAGRVDRTVSWQQGEAEFVTRVVHDTLDLRDALFFRRSRSVEHEARWPHQEPLRSSESFVTWGGWSSHGDVIVLRDYGPAGSAQRANDTLRIAQGTLIRRTYYMTADGIAHYDEVYQR